MLRLPKVRFKLPEKVTILLKSLQAKDISLYHRSFNTAEISLLLIRYTNIEHDFNEYDIYVSSLLHDIGKLYIPNDILLKQSGLTGRERELIQSHTVNLNFTLLPCPVLLSLSHFSYYTFIRYLVPSLVSSNSIPISKSCFLISSALE